MTVPWMLEIWRGVEHEALMNKLDRVAAFGAAAPLAMGHSDAFDSTQKSILKKLKERDVTTRF